MNPNPDQIAKRLSRKKYQGNVQPFNSRQKITEEGLEKIFSSFEGKYIELTVLKKELKGLIKVNDKDKTKSAISSTYLYRLSRHTKKKWRQKKGIGEDGELLVKFYTDGRFTGRRKKN